MLCTSTGKCENRILHYETDPIIPCTYNIPLPARCLLEHKGHDANLLAIVLHLKADVLPVIEATSMSTMQCDAVR